MCGDPYCGSCGDPGRMRAEDDAMERVNAAVGEDFEGRATCSCGADLLNDADSTPHRVLDRACAKCWAEDHPMIVEPEPNFDVPYEPY